MDKHELLRSTAIGVGAGVGLTLLLRLPILGMFIDCECPERGAGIALAIGGVIGALVGAITELARPTKKEP
jgi:hypothetical protein